MGQKRKKKQRKQHQTKQPHEAPKRVWVSNPGSVSKPEPEPARFDVGSAVRVKAGTRDPNYPDIPIGGWMGTVVEVEHERGQPSYEVEWNQATLDQIPPVYRKRCDRDDFLVERMWLDEIDLEPDTGEPVSIEQPTDIVTRPLSKHDRDDRIRAVFELTSDDPLPAISEENLLKYYQHLKTHLAFPFQARYHHLEVELLEVTRYTATMTKLAPPEDCNDEEGVICEGKEDGDPVELPLFEIEVIGNHPNRQLVEDYSYWFCNAPHDDEWDHDAMPASAKKPSFLQTIFFIGTLGALCGMVLGSVQSVMESARIGAMIGGSILGLFGCWFGYRLALFNTRGPKGQSVQLFTAVFGTLLGVLIGIVIGTMVVAILGLLAGVLAGILCERWILRGRSPVGGEVLGAMIGSTAQACYYEPEQGLTGAIVGATIGLVSAIVLFLTIFGAIALFEVQNDDNSRTE